MGFHVYECPPGFLATVPELMKEHGMAVTFMPPPELLNEEDQKWFENWQKGLPFFLLCLQAAFGTVEIGPTPWHQDTLHFMIGYGGNPLLWRADRRLFRSVHSILLMHGAEISRGK